MVFVQKFLKVERQDAVNPVKFFLEMQEDVKSFTKKSCFVRSIGIEGTDQEYIQSIVERDQHFIQHNQCYFRMNSLEKIIDPDKIQKYSQIYQQWESYPDKNQEEIFRLAFPFRFANPTMEWTQKKAFEKVVDTYREAAKGASSSMVKNFAVKLLGWSEIYLPKLYKGPSEQYLFPKAVYIGSIKQQEYLFLYFLFLLGCDVLYENPAEDVSLDSEQLKQLSQLHQQGSLRPCFEEIPPFKENTKAFDILERVKQEGIPPQNQMEGVQAASYPVSRQEQGNIRMTIPPRPSKGKETVPSHGTDTLSAPPAQGQGGNPLVIPPHPKRDRTAPVQQAPPEGLCPSGNRQTVGSGQSIDRQRQELDYVQLAELSPSVVMIKVYDDKRQCIKTGSGVVVNNNGYILTNFHVASGGHSYGVQFENEQQECFTDALVKYHSYNDLALLRVDRNCSPIPLAPNDRLVRGQKIVAIGSPLGLFNSISDGIVSGFRQLEQVSMVQFTAPTSPGSSGGALLNLYGELVGIITGGFSDGQNLNLAVDSATIRNFVRGFV